MALKDNLKRLRETTTSYNAKEFAAFLGLSYTTYMGYERGSWPNEETLVKIARALHVSIDDLLGYQLNELEECLNLCKAAGLVVQIDRDRNSDKVTNIAIFQDKRCIAQLPPLLFNYVTQRVTRSAAKITAEPFKVQFQAIAFMLQLVYEAKLQKTGSVSDEDLLSIINILESVKSARDNGDLPSPNTEDYKSAINEIVSQQTENNPPQK